MSAPTETLVRWVDISAYGEGAIIQVFKSTADTKDVIAVLGLEPDSKEGRDIQKLGFQRLKSGNALVLASKSLPAGILKCLPLAKVVQIPSSKVFYQSTRNAAPALKPLENELRQARFLGLNHLGQEVYAASQGRFLRMEQGTVGEREGGGGALFLRGDAAETLAFCADGFVEQMVRGKVMRTDDLRAFGATAYSLADRKMDVADTRLRQVQEAVEAAMQRRLAREFDVASEDSFNFAVKLLEHQPAFAFRTSDSVVFQQYSTPLPMALAAQRILGDTSGKRVREPTIGNGSLVMSLPRGTQIEGIEIDPERVARVQRLRDDLTVRQGDFLNESLATQSDFVISNPPFGRLDRPVSFHGLKCQRIDQLIALRALESRTDDGRAVLILGADRQNIFDQNAGVVAGGSKTFFAWLADHYEIEDCLEIDGGLYAKQGAGFPVRMVTVGRRRTASEAADALRTKAHRLSDRIDVVRSWDELWQRADALALRLGETTAQALAERARVENDFQAPYQPASSLGEPSAMVPRNLVGPLAKAFARLEEEYGMTVDELVANRLNLAPEALAAVLAPEQVDAVALGIRSVEQGAGLILGDQTGQGKGRVLAMMALYARRRGMPVAFMTEKANLFSDFYRDLKDAGVLNRFTTPLVLNDTTIVRDMDTNSEVFRSYPRGELGGLMEADTSLKDAGVDLLLTTYSQFNRPADKSKKSDWLPRAVEGAFVILDESHVAAGEGNTATNIARALDNAEACLYSSATFAKGARNMACYRKAFPAALSSKDLADTLQVGGEPLQEVLSAMLAADGRFIRREHDLSRVEFKVVIDEGNRERNERASDQLAEILSAMSALAGDVEVTVARLQREIRERLEQMSEAQRKGNRMGVSYVNFGSRLYNVMRQFMLSLKAETTADMMIESFKQGRKPAAILEQTFESLLREQLGFEADDPLEEGLDLSRFEDADERERNQETRDRDAMLAKLDGNRELEALADTRETADKLAKKTALSTGSTVIAPLTMRDVLHRMLDRIAIINRRDDYGSTTKSDVFQEADSKDEAEAAQFAMTRIRNMINAFPELPAMPLDVVRNKLTAAGISVDEISGRAYIATPTPDGQMAITPRKDNRLTVNYQFNHGDLDAAILTRAGSTGLSLHASEKFEDQRQREVFELQIANNVAERQQFFGRFDRRGQVCAPRVTTVVTALPSEVRVLAMQNGKLRKLSANVSSNRNNAAEMDVPDMLNSVGDEVARNFLLENPALALQVGFTREEIEDPDMGSTAEDPYINRLLGRLCLVPVSKQREVIADLTKQFNAVMFELEQKGVNPLRAYEEDWKARTVSEEMVSGIEQDYYRSEFDRPVIARTIEWDEERTPLRSDTLLADIAANTDRLIGSDGVSMHKAFANYDVDRPTFSKFIAQMREATLDLAELAKPKRFKSVSDALEDKANNVCKDLMARADWISMHLPSMYPGECLTVADPQMLEGTRRGVIVDVRLPSPQYRHRPGEYVIDVAFPGARRVETLTFAQLMREKTFSHMRRGERFSAMGSTWQQAFDAEPAGTIRRERTVLVGNLFAASELAAQSGMGMSGIYSDEQGRRHRGVILFNGVSMTAVRERPLPVTDWRTAFELITNEMLGDARSLQLTSTPRIHTAGMSTEGLRMFVDGNRIKLTTLGSRTRGGQWFANQKLLELTGGWAGDRSNMSVEVPVSKLESLMEVLYSECSTQFYIPHEHQANLQALMVANAEAIESERNAMRERIGSEMDEINAQESGDADSALRCKVA
jgi:hypothetical protein